MLLNDEILYFATVQERNNGVFDVIDLFSRVVGFEEIGNTDSFTTATLEKRIAKSGELRFEKSKPWVKCSLWIKTGGEWVWFNGYTNGSNNGCEEGQGTLIPCLF